jgi:hypothetical protein
MTALPEAFTHGLIARISQRGAGADMASAGAPPSVLATVAHPATASNTPIARLTGRVTWFVGVPAAAAPIDPLEVMQWRLERP